MVIIHDELSIQENVKEVIADPKISKMMSQVEYTRT